MNKFLTILAASFYLMSPQANAQQINGAGATFPAPLYSKWAESYNKETSRQLNYQAIGSGGGIKQIDAKTVDFGATDDPADENSLKSKGQYQFPTVIGGVVPVVGPRGILAPFSRPSPDSSALTAGLLVGDTCCVMPTGQDFCNCAICGAMRCINILVCGEDCCVDILCAIGLYV